MRLDVGLIIYIQAVFVAQLIETAVLRIVSQTNRIDVVAFHQLEVFPHQLLGYVVSRSLVVLMDVHTLEFQRLSVDEQHGIGFSVLGQLVNLLDFDATEPDVEGNDFGHLAVFLDRHQQFIQIGVLRSPCLHTGQRCAEVHSLYTTGRQAALLNRICHRMAFGIEQFVTHLYGFLSGCPVSHVHCQTEDTVLVSVVQRRYDPEVLDGHLGLCIEENVAFDAAQTPEVLTLQIRTRAPTEDFQHQAVLARLYIRIDQEFGRILGIFVISHFLPVDIDIDTRLGSGQMEVDISCL